MLFQLLVCVRCLVELGGAGGGGHRPRHRRNNGRTMQNQAYSRTGIKGNELLGGHTKETRTCHPYALNAC